MAKHKVAYFVVTFSGAVYDFDDEPKINVAGNIDEIRTLILSSLKPDAEAGVEINGQHLNIDLVENVENRNSESSTS